MPLDPAEEYRALIDAARALVAWEEEIGGAGFPAGEAPAPPPRAQRTEATRDAPRGASPPPEAPSAQPVRAEAPGAARGASSGRGALLGTLAEEAAACTACELHRGRTRSVFARGREDAELMFVGEGPGQREDETGLPFVGPAGQLLDKMIAAMGYERDEVYICNVVKCRPPENRTPSPEEAGACRRFLDGQIDSVRPRLIIALGRSAADRLGLVPESGRWRGELGEYRGVRAMATFHPAYLLRSPEQKRAAWADLKRALHFLGKTPP